MSSLTVCMQLVGIFLAELVDSLEGGVLAELVEGILS